MEACAGPSTILSYLPQPLACRWLAGCWAPAPALPPTRRSCPLLLLSAPACVRCLQHVLGQCGVAAYHGQRLPELAGAVYLGIFRLGALVGQEQEEQRSDRSQRAVARYVILPVASAEDSGLSCPDPNSLQSVRREIRAAAMAVMTADLLAREDHIDKGVLELAWLLGLAAEVMGPAARPASPVAVLRGVGAAGGVVSTADGNLELARELLRVVGVEAAGKTYIIPYHVTRSDKLSGDAGKEVMVAPDRRVFVSAELLVALFSYRGRVPHPPADRREHGPTKAVQAVRSSRSTTWDPATTAGLAMSAVLSFALRYILPVEWCQPPGRDTLADAIELALSSFRGEDGGLREAAEGGAPAALPEGMGIPPLQRSTCGVEQNGEKLTSHEGKALLGDVLAAVRECGATALGEVRDADFESVLAGVTQLFRCKAMAIRWSKLKSLVIWHVAADVCTAENPSWKKVACRGLGLGEGHGLARLYGRVALFSSNGGYPPLGASQPKDVSQLEALEKALAEVGKGASGRKAGTSRAARAVGGGVSGLVAAMAHRPSVLEWLCHQAHAAVSMVITLAAPKKTWAHRDGQSPVAPRGKQVAKGHGVASRLYAAPRAKALLWYFRLRAARCHPAGGGAEGGGAAGEGGAAGRTQQSLASTGAGRGAREALARAGRASSDAGSGALRDSSGPRSATARQRLRSTTPPCSGSSSRPGSTGEGDSSFTPGTSDSESGDLWGPC